MEIERDNWIRKTYEALYFLLAGSVHGFYRSVTLAREQGLTVG